jgi:hypothetical protein
MSLHKGARVIINQHVAGYDAGTPGRVIRVDERWISDNRYSVLLDEDGAVLENLTEKELFALDDEQGAG